MQYKIPKISGLQVKSDGSLQNAPKNNVTMTSLIIRETHRENSHISIKIMLYTQTDQGIIGSPKVNSSD